MKTISSTLLYTHTYLAYCQVTELLLLLFFLVFFYIHIYIFLLFHNVGLSLCMGYEAEWHHKAFEQISFAPIPLPDCPTGMVPYTVTYLLI